MPTRSALLALAAVGALAAAVPAAAQDTEASRKQLDKILAVLRARTAAAGKACLTAMVQVHDTEQSVKEHENDTGTHPELDIARDVLESDYQNSSQICGADADRVCREAPGPDISKPCGALRASSG